MISINIILIRYLHNIFIINTSIIDYLYKVLGIYLHIRFVKLKLIGNLSVSIGLGTKWGSNPFSTLKSLYFIKKAGDNNDKS